MQNWIIDIMEQFGYLGVFMMITLENVFPPIPSELVLPFGGFMTTYTSLSFVGVVGAATAGSVLGATILYGIGRLVDVPTLERIIHRWGHLLRVTPDDLRRADRWFARYGYWAVFLCRMVPLVRSLISVPAGMSHMNFGLFLLFTTLGTLLWNIVLVGAGRALGESWETISRVVDVYALVTYGLIALAVGVVLFLLARRWRRSNATERQEQQEK